MQILALAVILLPLISAIINGLCRRTISQDIAGMLACTAMSIAAICSCIIFYYVGIRGQVYHIILSTWLEIQASQINWAIYIDQLTSIMLVVVTVVAAVVHFYSLGYMHDDPHLPKFFCFLSLFTFFMLALVSADNFLQLFFGWEGVGLCSYLLIGYWHHKPSTTSAATEAFIINRISDCAFILGVVTIIIYGGSVNFQEVFATVRNVSLQAVHIAGMQFAVIDVICLLLFLGCMGKSAQIGLHTWLPDAMEGPTPVSALLHSATMVTAGVFLLARCSYIFEYSPTILVVITIVGGVSCLFAATIAIVQRDIKKIIAYSTCSQLGYMFLACGVRAYQAGIFHLVTHAFFKSLLFLAAGNVIHACHEQDVFKLGSLKSKMPITYSYFLIGSLALIGVFPLAGFYSKDLILESAYLADNVGYVVFAFGIIGAILTAIYSMKIIILVFHGSASSLTEEWSELKEVKPIMHVPLVILASGAVLSGAIGHYIFSMGEIPGYFAASVYNIHMSSLHWVPSTVKLLPLLVGIFGTLLGIYIYKNRLFTNISNRFVSTTRILQNKYYFDEFYELTFIKTTNCLAKLSDMFDKRVIDYGGPGAITRIVYYLSKLVRSIQTGYISNYAFIMILIITMFMTLLTVSFF